MTITTPPLNLADTTTFAPPSSPPVDSRQLQTNQTIQRVRWLRLTVPLGLFLLATTFEIWEHWDEYNPFAVDPLVLVEIFIFGIIGPLAIYLVLAYVEQLLHKVQQANEDIIQLNHDLEHKIATRTAELEEANLHLLELDQMKSDFVSMVSHELRAPLATLNGGLEVALQNKAQIPPKSQRILELLHRETARLTEFVQTILDVSQLEAGKIRVHCGPVAIKPLLHHAVELTFGTDQERIVWQLPDDVPPVWVDETYTEEILRNLFRNAQKYTPPHSPIELKIKVEKPSATTETGMLCICVTDYGPGIPADKQAQIFERFVQVSASPAKNGAGQNDQPRGWGLGLYLARMLLEQQGGNLILQSPAHDTNQTAAPGCRFKLRLPLALAELEEIDDGELIAY